MKIERGPFSRQRGFWRRPWHPCSEDETDSDTSECWSVQDGNRRGSRYCHEATGRGCDHKSPSHPFCPQQDHLSRSQKFCSKCGKQLQRDCFRCKRPNSIDDQFCSKCGAKQFMSDRELEAIIKTCIAIGRTPGFKLFALGTAGLVTMATLTRFFCHHHN